jgi:aspartyl-tRNA(Asn)/glutamyl-tRNA(Gln) amidotransferase subunit A
MEAAIIAGAVRLGSRRAVDVVREALDRAEKAQHLGAFTQLHPEHAMDRAAHIDAQVAAGENPGRLAGVPIAIKDNIAHAGMPLGAASRMLDGYIAPRTATALARLEAEGAVVIGRTNMDEFGMGSSGENSASGPTLNPVNTAHVPGGSSSGSAAAVAAGIVPLSLGSDTGGSVRQPASFCGVVGLKPTYGRISRSGLLAFGSSLDQIGPLARSVRDVAIATHIMAGEDPLDSTTLHAQMGSMEAERDPDLSGCTVGLPEECWRESDQGPVHQTVRAAIAQLEELGATVQRVQIPSLQAAIPTYYLLTSAEAASNLSRFDGIRYGPRASSDDLIDTYTQTRTEGFGPEVQRRILLGTFALAEGWADDLYRRANAVRARMRAEIDQALSGIDALMMPTAPSTAFRLGEKTTDPIQMYLSDIFTTPPSLTGHPALSVPAGSLDGLPVGAQIVTRHEDEATALRLGMAINGR